MEEQRKPRHWLMWLVASLVVAYPLSLYPTHWLIARKWLPISATAIYEPIDYIAQMAPRPIYDWWNACRFDSQTDCLIADGWAPPDPPPIP